MKKLLPWIILALTALWVLSGLRSPKDPGAFRVADFGRMPVLLNGRVQPLNSVGRNALLLTRTRRSVSFKEAGQGGDLHRRQMGASEWLLEAMTKPEAANTRPIFRTDHPDLKDLLKLPADAKEHYFSWNDLQPSFRELDKQAQRSGAVEPKLRTQYDTAVVRLHQGLILFQRLKNSLKPEGAHDFAAEFKQFQADVAPGIEAFRKNHAGEEFDKDALNQFGQVLRRYEMQSQMAYPLIIPPADPAADPDAWQTLPAALLSPVQKTIGQVTEGKAPEGPIQLQWQPEIEHYATVATAYHNNQPEEFNAALVKLRSRLQTTMPRAVSKGWWEHLYNHWEPFYRATTVYFLAFLLGCFSWIGWFKGFNRSALYLLLLGFVVHTAGVAFRMGLEGRPPVTNLYSSAVFVGWGTVVLGLFLEFWFRNSIGVVMAAAVGFVTQIVAHNLSLGGDTMEMMRAVLDSNFWLATHVITITIGYSAMFAAGMLAILYILLGVLTKVLRPDTRKALEGMVYGVICFATLFSFVGTILGGIWADQSWGRFWGWDPKENGALFIVLWCAVILHARWGKLVGGRGLMNLAIGGNIVTSLSWFGVNMLGVGLHAYGFMDSAFRWLMIFIASQAALILLGLLPTAYWRSFREQDADKSETPTAAPPESKLAEA